MRGVWKLTWIEIKLFLREPMAAFFTLAFPMLLLLLFGAIFGNEPTPFFGGVGYVDTSVPAFAAMIVATTGLISLTILLASYREQGILRRLRATPLRPQAILMAQVTVMLLMTILGMVLLILVGVAVYGLRFSGNAVSVAAGFLFSSLSFFALGFVLGGAMPTARTAQIVAMALFYTMLFLSGAAIPWEVLPKTVQNYAQVLPLTHVVGLLRGLWVGDGWMEHLKEVAVIGGVLLGGVVISARTFRWE